MKTHVLVLLLFGCTFAFGQQAEVVQQKFCKNLAQVFESGRNENFESINGMSGKQSSILIVPGYSIKLDPFYTIYVDKDNRFVGKTDLQMDSLSALKKLEELRPFVNHCLDSTNWVWVETTGDDSTTVFFKEIKQLQAFTADFNLSLAMDRLTANLFTVNIYIRRNRK